MDEFLLILFHIGPSSLMPDDCYAAIKKKNLGYGLQVQPMVVPDGHPAAIKKKNLGFDT
jgi:hypothetical protein